MQRGVFILILLILTVFSYATEKYAVIIGINDYMNDRIQDLRYSEADADYLADVLFRYGRYKPDHIKLLLGKEATYANIKKEVYWLGEVTQPEDEVFFYFSGHGTRVEDKDGNEDDYMDEAFCPYETDLENKASVILDDEMGHWFGRIKANKVVVVLDCCHSGGAAGKNADKQGTKSVEMDLPTTARGHINPDMNPYAMDLSIDNKFVMTASKADQQSFENPELGHGVFTYYLGKAIQGESDQNGDNVITTEEIFTYTKKNTEAFAKTIRKDQTPERFGSLDVPLSEKDKCYCGLSWYDSENSTVDLSIYEQDAKPGDVILIRRSGNQSRDLNVRDDKIMKVKLTQVASHYAEGKIVESYFDNIQIKPQDYPLYYGEKVNVGHLSIFTDPWSIVYLNGEKMGPTPLQIEDVPEGEYDLTFKLDIMGYPNEINKTIAISPNDTLRLSERFEKTAQ